MRVRKAKKSSHPKGGQKAKPAKKRTPTRGNKRKILLPADASNPAEKALTLMKGGVSQADAAKAVGISSQRLARYRAKNTRSVKKDGKWFIRDRRPAEMHIASKAKQFPIAVPYRSKSTIGLYWNAVNRFLTSNSVKELRSFDGRIVRDILGKRFILETDPNTLRMMDAIGELNFLEIYAQTAN